ncbi:MAG TPA: DUF2127 domain-containing protein [Thermoleophilaceae bacterium]|nr:DUF2127 domain-containing protein [Thermoleophilaceae bacterium]
MAHRKPHRPLPGTVKPERFRPKFHWELLVCGARGHELVGHDAEELRAEDALYAFAADGVRWHRCLRCDSWLPFPEPEHPAQRHPPPRDDIVLPLRGKPLRDKVVLRLIAVNRAFHFVLLGLLGTAILLFAANEAELKETFYRVVADLQDSVGGGPVQTSKTGILHELDRLFTLKSSTLTAAGLAVWGYAIVEGVEAVGLWYQQRWAEYLTFIVTTSFIPLEVYELVHKFTPFKVLALIVNTAIVVYLLYAKRLFGFRGGAAADEALRERDIGWQALEASSPAAVALSGSGPQAGSASR